MSEKRWYAVDPDHFRRPVSERIGKATVTSSTSPYSVPDAVTAYTDKQGGTYFFELKYIGPEEPVEGLIWKNYSFLRGKNSRRLFQVTFNQAPSGIHREAPAEVYKEQILDDIKSAITNVSTTKSWPIANSAIVAAVIDETKERLIHDEDNDSRFALGA